MLSSLALDFRDMYMGFLDHHAVVETMVVLHHSWRRWRHSAIAIEVIRANSLAVLFRLDLLVNTSHSTLSHEVEL